MMRTETGTYVIFEPGTVEMLAVCDGPDENGRCSLRRADGRFECAGKDVTAPASIFTGRLAQSVSRVRLLVAEDAPECPLVAAGYRQRTRRRVPA